MTKQFFVLAASNDRQKKIKCFTNRNKFGEALRACDKKQGVGYSAMEFEVQREDVIELVPIRYYNNGVSGFTAKQMEKTVCAVGTHVLGYETVINWPDDFQNIDVPERFAYKFMKANR